MKKKRGLRWNLDEVATEAGFEKLRSEIRKETKKAETWIKKLRPEMGIEDFGKMMKWWMELEEKIARLVYLPHLREETRQNDRKAKLLKMQANDTALECEEKIRPISHWLKGLEGGEKKLDDKNAKRLFASQTKLKYFLEYGRKAAKHSLALREEEIASNKDSYGLEAVLDLREMIETRMRYKIVESDKSKVTSDKSKVVKTQAELMKYVHSVKKEEREGAYRALFEAHKKEIDKLFLIYQTAVKNWDYEAKIRGYKSAIAMRNFANRVPDEAVESLLSVCEEKRGIFGKFFEFKAKTLGVKKLNRFDLYAPMPKEEKKAKKYSFETAKKIVLETMYDFSDKFGARAEIVFDDEHIDSHPRPQKRSGAFCATVGPKISPFVLLNHTGDWRSISTLAHELGHAVHGLYANKQEIVTQDAPLPLAETASTLAEMILFEKILAKEKDEKIKKSMLWEKISDSYATVLRQNYFVKFEIEAHKRFGWGLEVEDLGEIWLSGLKEQFGKSVEVDKVFADEWSYIPHIVQSPFYCYSYSFGELLSLAMFAQYKKEGKSMVKKIEKILETGGSEEPEKILARVGIEMKDKKFWEKGFGIIENWVEELKK